MRKLSMLFVALFTVLSANVMAQDEDYITEENLRRYALMNEVIDAMKSEINAATNDMISNQDGITGSRFLEVSKGNGDPATEFETKFVEKVNEMRNDRIEALKEVNQILATKMLPNGGKAYKAIKTAISSDPEVKAQYEAILVQIQLADEEV